MITPKNMDLRPLFFAVEGANVVRNAIQDAVRKAALGEMTVDAAWTEAVTVSNAALKGE